LNNEYFNTKNYARTMDVQDLPSLIDIQLKSFQWFLQEGLLELFDEISPIESYNGNLKLYFPSNHPESTQFGLKFWYEEPKNTREMCLERDMSYTVPLYAKVALVNKEAGDHVIISDIFMGELPLMTDKGTFIINGTERVVVSQLIRSPGVYFEAEEDRTTGRKMAAVKLIPDRGAWMEFETRKSDALVLKFNRKRTVPVTVLLRALAAVKDAADKLGVETPLKLGTDEEILALYADIDTHETHQFIKKTLEQEPDWSKDNRKEMPIAELALIEFYKKMRPGDPPTLENAREYLEQQLFDQRRYDLERVGRYKLNKRLGLTEMIPPRVRTITKMDIIRLIARMININNDVYGADDIDHLGNRRVKTVGELIQNKLRVGLRRAERVIKERMSVKEQENPTPSTLINIRPIVAAIREFFGSSQLSQFMEQTNPLAELRHKRTLSALGPGGLRRERAGFDVRDVHHSHYGRICPIETPEGPNIGLIGRLASYARVNDYGFIETPYRRVLKVLPLDDVRLPGRKAREDIETKGGDTIVEDGGIIDEVAIKAMRRSGIKDVPVVPFMTGETIYLSADAEDNFVIAQADTPVDELGQVASPRVSARLNQDFKLLPANRVDYIDIAPRQIVGISAALIPFLEHDDANRALMGSNMQSQAVPLLDPDIPLVSTGMEAAAALDSGQIMKSAVDGEVISVQGDRIIIRDVQGEEHTYKLRKYQRSNQSTCIDQKPIVRKGQQVKVDTVLADSSSTFQGSLALGHNVLAAFLCWDGGNYEDALLISEEMLRRDKFTSIHIEKHEVEARETKLGSEEITYDIPNVGEEALKDLDEFGIVRIGAEVGPNDILVGKITPKGERELSPEEKLLRAIFGEQAREVKDSSLRLPHGERGKVVDVKTFTREEHRDLPAGVEKMVRVGIAQRRKLTVGDKMAGRHGNKGVISRMVSIEDMPYLEDGRPVEIILNPTGVPGRMNLGQVLELHLGWAADRLGFRAITPVFDGATENDIRAELGRAWMIDHAQQVITERAWEWIKQYNYSEEELEDDEEVRRLYTHEWLKDNGRYDNTMLIGNSHKERTYRRRAVLAEWLREEGYNPDDLLLYESQSVVAARREEIEHNALNVSLREWTKAIAPKIAAQIPDDADTATLYVYADRAMFTTGMPLPHYGKMTLYDGRTGEPFDNSVAVGFVHMLKLAHLVEDKVHARSTGPYSLVTQQPLGGKAQFGGQRLGEMEVWALEAYGAAYTLQEMLTVKSDDVQGRIATYEAIVKGEKIQEPGIPSSFRVLVKELQSLGLSVEAITEDGEVLTFGKEDDQREAQRQKNQTSYTPTSTTSESSD